MNRVNLLFSLLVVASLFVLSLDVSAQRKIITYREYYDGISMAGVKYYEKSRHVETTEETLVNGTVTRSEFQIDEELLPDRHRNYTKIAEGGKISEFEQITIDYMQYTRRDAGPWTKVDLRKAGYGSGTGSGSGSSRQCDQYSVEPATLNGMPVQLFEWVMINGNGPELMFQEIRKWIGDEGLPYREENIRGRLSPREETSKRVVTYEYDPKIAIEAPIK